MGSGMRAAPGRRSRTGALGLATAAIAAAVLAPLAEAAPSPAGGCTAAARAIGQPTPPLRFGITPAGEAGSIGPPVPLTPIDMGKTFSALSRLRPPRAPFVLRLNRFFWSDGQRGIHRFAKLARTYTRRGYRVELQLRYHPTPAQEGDIPAWVRFVREVVRRFGPNPGVTGLQVTNEVNLYPIAPDASDSSFDGARDALIRGVEAAHRTARRQGYRQLEIGFNWFYRTDPSNEASFWGYLRDRGGRRFARAVDWVGLDAYPGTVFPPVPSPVGSGFRDAMGDALGELRDCFMPVARLGRKVPIHVEENGWPTGPGRPEREQVTAMRQMVGAASDLRALYHVTDYRWFDLRDHNTSSANFQQHYGLLRDDYSRKPAFGVYRRLVRRLSGS
jgi:hypothetical protein